MACAFYGQVGKGQRHFSLPSLNPRAGELTDNTGALENQQADATQGELMIIGRRSKLCSG